jgi:glutathione S-transferase
VNTLISIPFSHYCEKARWALSYCRVGFVERRHLPFMHFPEMVRAGGKTVPVLLRDGETALCDSTEIVGWADSQAPAERRLFGDEKARARAEQLEDDFDEKLGVASRLWSYAWGLDSPVEMRQLIAPGMTPTQRRLLPWLLPLARPLITRRYGITPFRVQEAMRTVEATFIAVAELLGDRQFLVGHSFSAADLTFAALAAPIVLPDEHPALAATAFDVVPTAARGFIERMRLTPAGKFALKLYRWYR